MVSRFAKIFLVAVLIAAIIFGVIFYITINNVQCLGCRIGLYKNSATGECSQFCIGCGMTLPSNDWHKIDDCKVREQCKNVAAEQLNMADRDCGGIEEIIRRSKNVS